MRSSRFPLALTLAALPLLCGTTRPQVTGPPHARGSAVRAPGPPGQLLDDSILWFADHEEGTLADWTLPQFQYAGGGIFNTGGAEVEAVASTDVARSGSYSARATITNAYRAQNGSRAVRLMRWTDTAWDDGGTYFPDEAYYSAWFYFPETYNPNKYGPWDPGDGGWWNVFQFKAHDAAGVSQPVWTLNVYHDDERGEMSFYLYTKENEPRSWAQPGRGVPIPVGRWVHVEAFLRLSTTGEGRITIWQDGRRILDADQVNTAVPGGDGQAIWGIGNYTDHIAGGPVEGEATIYFDDAAVSTKRLSRRMRR